MNEDWKKGSEQNFQNKLNMHVIQSNMHMI